LRDVADSASSPLTEEEKRLAACASGEAAWRRFGPYLSERQWGTVREDYSADGNAWDSFRTTMPLARVSLGRGRHRRHLRRRQRLCFALALWNGADPILKERLFGLTGTEGNHGEDVKEYYFYLDNVPSHAYMKYLYKYPQRRSRTTTWSTQNRRRRGAIPNTSCSTPGSSTTTAISTYSSNTPRRSPATS
jgi:hypothetical protein